MRDDSTPTTFSFVEPIELDPAMVHTPIWKDAPLAPARLTRTKTGRLFWQVVRCPYCGKTHEHGAGGRDKDPRRLLGGRIAHCHMPFLASSWGNEYRLIAIDGSPSRAELDRFFPRYRLHSSDDSGDDVVFEIITGVKVVRAGTATRQPIPRQLRAAVWQKTQGHCYLCGALTNPFDNLHIDHLQPIADGGTNDLTNLWPACATCNQQKHAMSLEAFRQRRGGGLFWFEIARMGGVS